MTDTEQTVFIVDDDEPVRDAISMLLETMDIRHETFADAAEFLQHVSLERRGCLVLDIRMPGMSGLDLQERLNAQGSALPIVFITGHGDIPMAVEAMKRGAIDFIRKPFRDQELLDRINEALNLSADHFEEEQYLEQIKSCFNSLSPRETEVFGRVAVGQANKVVAIELGISERTVEIHRSQVMKKMKARTLADLVRMKIALERS